MGLGWDAEAKCWPPFLTRSKSSYSSLDSFHKVMDELARSRPCFSTIRRILIALSIYSLISRLRQYVFTTKLIKSGVKYVIKSVTWSLIYSGCWFTWQFNVLQVRAIKDERSWNIDWLEPDVFLYDEFYPDDRVILELLKMDWEMLRPHVARWHDAGSSRGSLDS
jgi:hypothetical protein